MEAWQAAPVELPAESAAATRSRLRAWLGPAAGLALLIATLHYVDQGALRARFSQLRAAPILLGSALMLPQLYWLALRWRLTTRALGLELSQRRALREYALSILLNQLLPFGIVGDAIRIWRFPHKHAGDQADGTLNARSDSLALNARSDSIARRGNTLRAACGSREPARVLGAPESYAVFRAPRIGHAFSSVLLDRLMGQLVLVSWALCTLPLWLGVPGLWLCVLALLASGAFVSLLRRLPEPTDLQDHATAKRALLGLSSALRQLLASPRYLVSQLVLSSLLVLSIVAQLYCALWALGLSLSAAQATQVFPLMLLSMSVPLSFAGFGPREAVTAELYSILQLSAADGAAFAIAFGVIVVCASLPCLLLVLGLRADAEPAA